MMKEKKEWTGRAPKSKPTQYRQGQGEDRKKPRTKDTSGPKAFGKRDTAPAKTKIKPKPYGKARAEGESQPRENEADSFQLEGRNAVLEALRAGRPIDALLVKKGEAEGTIKVIVAMAKEKGIVVKDMTREKLDELSQTGRHQGVIALCAAHEYAEIEDILALARERGQEPFVILLDGITDPHNLGAIIRTAEAAGAHGVIIPQRRAVGLTAVVGKTSAGALQYVPVARVINMTAAIETLKRHGLWIACADMDGQPLYEAPLSGAIGLVIGGEGSGVSRLVKEKCDFVVSIPLMGQIQSLNASVAAAVLMYEAVRRRAEGSAIS